MKKFTDWLNENIDADDYIDYYKDKKGAFEWKKIWLKIAKNYVTNMKQEDLIDHVDAIVSKINKVSQKLEDLGYDLLTSNQVAALAGNETTGNPDLDAHYQAMADAIKRVE